METLKVSTRSHPNSVAGAIAGLLRREGYAVLTVVGAGALNQAIKALAITIDHVAGEGMDPVCIPSFTEVDIDGTTRTAILLRVEDRNRGAAADRAARGHRPASPRRRGRRLEPRLHRRRGASPASWGDGGLTDA